MVRTSGGYRRHFSSTVAIYPARKSTARVLLGLGAFLVALPSAMGIALSGQPENVGAAVVVGLIMVPPGLFLVSVGLACRKLRMEIDEDGLMLRVTLPRTTAILFPWKVKPEAVPLAGVRRVDVKWRANPYMPGGVEGLYFLRTDGGDFHFNAKWFPDHEAVMARLAELAEVETTEENLDLPQVVASGEPPARLLASEKAMRGCGYSLIGLSVVLMVCALLVACFGEPEDRGAALRALLVLGVAIPASRMLLRYRRAR